MKEHYVKAVLELLEGGKEPSTVVEGLKHSLRARRQEALLKPVLERVLTILETSDRGYVMVSVVDEKALETLKEEIKQNTARLDAANVEKKIIIDPSLIGGSVVRYRHTSVDASYKQALVSLYRSITTD